MNPIHWSTHAKHILIALIGALALVGAFIARGVYDARVADRMAKRDEQISANQLKSAQTQKDNKADASAITTRDLQNAMDVAALRAKAAQGLTAAEADALITAKLQGATKGKDAQGNDTTTVGTGYLADTLNRFTINQQICDKNLSTCEADKANLNQIIGRLTSQAQTDQGTIGLQAKQITDLQKFQVPRHMFFFGVGKTQGTNFQDANSYQPVLGYGYRLTDRWGFLGVVQNRSAAVGVTWNVGSVPGHK